MPILAAGADMNIENDDGMTAMAVAKKEGLEGCVELFASSRQLLEWLQDQGMKNKADLLTCQASPAISAICSLL